MHLQQLKGMQRSEKEVRRKVCERDTICQLMVYERGTFFVKNGT